MYSESQHLNSRRAISSSRRGSADSRRHIPAATSKPTATGGPNLYSQHNRRSSRLASPPPNHIDDVDLQAFQPPRAANAATDSKNKPRDSKGRVAVLLILALFAIAVALLRFDMLPLVHIGAESLIWASILSTLVLFAYLFYLICRRLWKMYRDGYKLPVLVIPLLFTSFAGVYIFLNIIAQAFDPTIDRVLKDLPEPGPKTVFARRGDSYEQVALPVDRRISADEISDSIMRDAIIAVEDERLEARFGPIDLEALLRGTVKTFVLRRRREGGSTILIQVAKNILKWPTKPDALQGDVTSVVKTEGKEFLSRALLRKCKELLLSLRLAQRFPQVDEQLALYISISPMGGSDKEGRNHTLAYAAEDLFGVNDLRALKRADADSILVSAMLVGMLKAPTSYHPRLHPAQALARRNIALSQMAKKGMLEEDTVKLQLQAIRLRDLRRAKNLKFYYNASTLGGPSL